MKLPSSEEIVAFHDRALARPGRPSALRGPVWEAIEDNHAHNCSLWEQEDLARRRNVPDSEIAGNKRAIDAHNQKRNDAIERIDESLVVLFQKIKPRKHARQSSETAGAMVDRLSILSLKIHHMRIQTKRKDADRAHRQACSQKLVRLTEQRADLGACFDRLLDEAAKGKAFFKVYRQFKMYNDPKLNPAIYGETGKRKA